MQSLAVKASAIIVTLMLMVAGVVAAIAYTGYSQQTRVRAQENILIDFGNVFPGMVTIEPFTIELKELEEGPGVNYTLTMSPPTDTSLSDIRPFMVVQKNSSESDTEIDGLADGRTDPPDYTAAGTLTNPGDLSDTWLAIFHVPDVNGVDYACQIQIDFTEPN